MTQQSFPPGQGPIDPRGAFAPVPPPGNRGGWMPPPPPNQLPPMPMPPPMPWGPPPPPPRGGGFSKAIFTTLATSIFGLSLLLNVYLLIATGLTKSDRTKTNVITEGDSKDKIAVVSVSGIMMSEAAERFNRLIKQVEKDNTVRGLVIDMNTPGGSVGAADQMYHRIIEYKTSTKLPVYVFMSELGTSGGYYLACAADEVYAIPTCLTGNIGVLMPRYDLSKFADKYGIHDNSIHSTGADYKTAGSFLREETPEEHAYLLGLIDQSFAQFKSVIVTGRGSRLTKPIGVIANGKAYLAPEAKALGLIDDVIYREDVFKKLIAKTGVSNPTIVRYEDPPNIFDLFNSQSNIPTPKGQSVTINGINLNVDANLLHDLMTPRLMYLWRGD